jgi:hypothetical protein
MSLTCIFTASNSPHLAQKCTGLGNVLFQIAAVYGIAEDTGRVAEFIDLENYTSKLKALTGEDYMEKIFRNVARDINFKYCEKTVCPHRYTDDFKESLVSFVNSNYDKNICFEGHFESHHYFSSCVEKIRSMFQPDPESLAVIQAKYPILFDPSKKCASIHIRKHHTSFRDDVDYVKRAIDFLPNDITYIVVSNDFEAVMKEFAPLGKEFIFADQNHDFIDMWIISLCKYNIMSHSTMSWWGAFLNSHEDKVVVCPQTMQNIYPGPISNLYFKTYVPL